MSLFGILINVALILSASILAYISALALKRRRTWTAVCTATVALGLLSLSTLSFVSVWHYVRPLRYISHIPHPHETSNYVLYHGRRTHSWHVFKLSTEIEPTKYRVRENYMTHIDQVSQSKGWREKRVLYNARATGEASGNGSIYLIRNKHLVLVRNGLFQGLYDIETAQNVIDDKHVIPGAYIEAINRISMFEADKYLRDMHPKPGEEEIEQMLVGFGRALVHRIILDRITDYPVDIEQRSALDF